MVRARFARLVCCAILLVAFPSMLCPTTIVGIWTPKRITIAADSRQTTIHAGQIAPAPNPSCKVFQAHHLVFGLAGLAQVDQVVVADEIKNSTPLKDQGTGKLLPLQSVVVPAIGAVVKVLQAHNATYTPDATIQLLIGGMIDGTLKMCRVEMFGFQITGQFSYARGSRQYCYPDALTDVGHDLNRDIEVIGLDQAIKSFKKQSPDWNRGKDAKVASRLISVEANDPDASKFVAPPITIVSVDKKGVHWVDKGPCTWEPEPYRK